MRRGETGKYQITNHSGEQVRAYIPAPLPPDPPIAMDGPLQQALESASLALGRLDSISVLLPDPSLFIYTYVRKEALLSSQIEGTQSSLSELLIFENDQVQGVPLDDVTEVSNYVAALEHGLARLQEGFPLSNRLIREIHGVLLSRGRGSDRDPGEFRRSQNWIGGSRPGNASFVPPPHTELTDCMGYLERFLHAIDDGLPVLARAGMAHVQFETIHPFLDGNGRVGRLLVTLLLYHYGALREPTLYLSLYLKRNRSTYYDLLRYVRATGDWEEWLAFFFEGVRETAEGAVSTCQRLLFIFEEDREIVQKNGGRRANSALRVHQSLMSRPVSTLSEISKLTGLAFPGASSGMQLLTELGIASEITGQTRNRIFSYDRYIAILNEGTEPL
ncbi:MAG: Fic family protein [Dehalococcoidia bacterium]|nr:Fic family protein [Dehalococcoidia bacterium]